MKPYIPKPTPISKPAKHSIQPFQHIMSRTNSSAKNFWDSTSKEHKIGFRVEGQKITPTLLISLYRKRLPSCSSCSKPGFWHLGFLGAPHP